MTEAGNLFDDDKLFDDGKDDAAFRTIGEVSSALGIKPHVLRYWEEQFPMLKPVKRSGQRRYYRPEDITLLTRIGGLLYTDGYTIKGVQKLLREGGGKLEPALASGATPNAAGSDQTLKGELEGVVSELEDIRSLLRGAKA